MDVWSSSYDHLACVKVNVNKVNANKVNEKVGRKSDPYLMSK